MKTFSKTGTTASYEYNGEGQRISKTVNGTKTEYFLDGDGTILGEKTGLITVAYLFDEAGRRIGYSWATDTYPGQIQGTYYYVFNGQGDVIALMDSSGVIWARYVYDAWGKLLAVTDANGKEAADLSAYIANLNSFRYRGYYYDTESGLYFLNTRSYDPTTGRFINADGVLGANGDMSTYNLFAYCGNNPVNYADPTGCYREKMTWDDVLAWTKMQGPPRWDVPINEPLYTLSDALSLPSSGSFGGGNLFGVQTSTTVIEGESKKEYEFGLFTVSTSTSASYDIDKGNPGVVTAYANTTSKKVGIKVKTGDVSGNIGTGLDGLLSEKASITIGNNTYSMGYKEQVVQAEYTFSIYDGYVTNSYTFKPRKWVMALAAVAPCVIPLTSAGSQIVNIFSR